TAGILGQPTTTTLFGGGPADTDARSGFRFGVGYWFGSERVVGAEVGFMMIESRANLFTASSDQTPIIARPFTDVNSFSQQAVLVAFPGVSNGSVAVRAASGNFYEGHFDL